MFRKITSSTAPPQNHFWFAMSKIFVLVTLPLMYSLWYYLFHSTHSAFVLQSWVPCWMALVSISRCSFFILHISIILDCVILFHSGSLWMSCGLLHRALCRSAVLSLSPCSHRLYFPSCLSAESGTERISVSWRSRDGRVFVVRGVVAK